jgi:hypothetical protein
MDTLFTPNGQTDIHTLLAVTAFFQSQPEGLVNVGVWPETTWDARQFWKWVHECLMDKIASHDPQNGRKMTRHYQLDLWRDAQVINDFFRRRIVRRGRNILRTPEMKRPYPQIDNSTWDD